MTKPSLDHLPDWPAAMRESTAAAYLDVSVAKFRAMVETGEIGSPVIIGGLQRWTRAQLDATIPGRIPAEAEPW